MADIIDITVIEGNPNTPDVITINVQNETGPGESVVITDELNTEKWSIILGVNDVLEFRYIDGDSDDLAFTLNPNGDAEIVGDLTIGGTYNNLPKATVSSLGAIIVGANLTIDANGVLNADAVGEGVGNTWEFINGIIEDQADLMAALALKADLESPSFTGTVTTPSLIVEDLTDGYIPYQKIADDKLSDSPVYSNGVYIGTLTFVAGYEGYGDGGWRMAKDTVDGAEYISLTIDNLTVRGKAKFYEVEIDKLTSVCGGIIISVANGKATTVSAGPPGHWIINFDTDGGNIPVQFVVDDYVCAQTWNGRGGIDAFVGKVTNIDATSIVVLSNDTPWDGMDLAQKGNNSVVARQNVIYITAADVNNPYIEGSTEVTAGSFVNKQKFRLGNLAGITDANFGGPLTGFGLYSDNVYLSGIMRIASGIVGGFTASGTELNFYDNVSKYLYLNNALKTSGAYGRGLTIYNNNATTGDISAVSVGQIRPKDTITYTASEKYGFEIIQRTGASTYKHLIRMAGDENIIGGWNIDDDAIYTGTKHTSDGYSTDGITFSADGSIHAPAFYLNADGYVMIAGTDMTHLITKIASGNVRNTHDAETSVSNNSNNFVKLKTITFVNGLLGTIRVAFQLKTNGEAGTGKATIVNTGAGAQGAEQTATDTYVTKTADFTGPWLPGEGIELWGYANGAALTTYVRQLKIYYDDNPLVAVESANT